MSQVSPILRRAVDRYVHWCPGCEQNHPLPDSWEFNGDVNKPTFKPSFKQTITRFDSYDADGRGVGEQRKLICHYVITDGVLNYCDDCWHSLKLQKVPMPPFSEGWA